MRSPQILLSQIGKIFGENQDDINKIDIDPTGKSLISCDDTYFSSF